MTPDQQTVTLNQQVVKVYLILHSICYEYLTFSFICYVMFVYIIYLLLYYFTFENDMSYKCCFYICFLNHSYTLSCDFSINICYHAEMVQLKSIKFLNFKVLAGLRKNHGFQQVFREEQGT